MEVYERIRAYEKQEYNEFRLLPSGISKLDDALGGGLEEGAACLIVGPSGTGKSTLASLFAVAAAERGEHAAVYLFDERPETYKLRAGGVGIPLKKHVQDGSVSIRQLDPAEIAPGQFAQQVRDVIENRNTKVVVIDSVAGYFNAVGSSDLFVAQLHELLTFLSRSGVLTILAGSQEGFMSIGEQQGVDISYLSDSILVLGYIRGEWRDPPLFGPQQAAAGRARNGDPRTEDWQRGNSDRRTPAGVSKRFARERQTGCTAPRRRCEPVIKRRNSRVRATA